MDPQHCYICNSTSVFYSRNLFKTKSKFTETRICEFIQNLLGEFPSEREYAEVEFNSGDSDYCVCIECLNKIDEYDLATMTAKRIEKELREILLHTEALFYRETKSTKTCLPMNHEVEVFDEKVEHGSESNKDDSDSDDDYVPSNSKIQLRHSAGKIELLQKRPDDQLKCTTCNKDFKTVSALARHKHVQSDTNQYPKVLNCVSCSEVFCTKTQYDHHLKKHKEQFKCTICNFDLKEKDALEKHTELHDGLSQLQCVLCQKIFKQKGALVRHMRIHSGLHFYQCHRCGKGFVHKSSFEMHLLAHDDIRKKKCPHCDQMFRSTSHLNRHLRIHTGSKPFSCPVCGQKFAQRYNMNVHQRLHDTSSNRLKNEKSHICKFCNSAFARQSKLEEHLKKNHEAVIPHTSIGNNLDDTHAI